MPLTHTQAGYLFALLATVIWSGNFVVARGLAETCNPVLLAFFRWLTAVIVLLPFTWRRLRDERAVLAANLRTLIPASLLGVTLFNTLVYIAGRHTTALNLSLISVLMPVCIIVLARIFLAEAVTPQRLAGVFLALCGAVLLAVRGNLSQLAALEANPGDLLMFAATIIFAFYSIMVRRKPPTISPPAYLAATFLLGLAMLTPWAAWEWLRTPESVGAVLLQPHVVGSVLYIGVGAALLSYLFWNKALALVGPSRAGMVYYSMPLFSGLEAWVILGEGIHWFHGVAGALILGGIVTATRSRAPQPR